MQNLEPPIYYYWWSDQCNVAFPERRFKINLNGTEVLAIGYSNNYYLDEICWLDKIVVGTSKVHPHLIIKSNAYVERINNQLKKCSI